MAACDTPYFANHSNPAMGQIPVPCGKCPPCKQRRVNSWVFRLTQEEKRSASAIFVTLTYGTHSVPCSKNGYRTLEPNDMRLYIKRLRKLIRKSSTPTSIKYYFVGEYGGGKGRPHYHMILFNCMDQRHAVNAWAINGQPIGGVHVGTVTTESVAYTMKYIDKSGFKIKHARDDRYPEFSRSSQNLGDNYLTDEMKAWHRIPGNLYCSLHSGHRIALPRYYKLKIFTDAEIKSQLPYIQKQVRLAELENRKKIELRYRGTDITYDYIMEQRKYSRYTNYYNRQRNKRNKA